jgi:hypothetical protein
MNRKQFGILVLILILIGGAAWLLQNRRNREAGAGEQGTGQKLLGASFPMNEVAHISLQQNTNALTLFKKDDLWRVRERSGYPANFSMISAFLIKLGDLKVIQNEEIGPSQLPRLDLAPPGHGTNSGVIVDLKNKDENLIASLTLGKKHFRQATGQASQFDLGGDGVADGRYVLVGNNSKNALLIADALNNIEIKPEDWLDKDFFKIERPKSISVIYPSATNSWKLSRDNESGDWQLVDMKADEKLDPARVSGVSNPFSAPSFNDVLPSNAPLAQTGLDTPTTVTVDTFDDFTYVVKIGKKSGDNYPLTIFVEAHFPKLRTPEPNEKPDMATKADEAWRAREKLLGDQLQAAKKFENWIYLVPTWNVDPVLKMRGELLADKKDQSKSAKADDSTPAADSLPIPSGK